MIGFMNKHLIKFWLLFLLINFLLVGTTNAKPAEGWIHISPIIAKVSVESGVDVKLLAAMGAIESSFRVDARNPNSTATGLFQFTKRTWRVTLNSYGSHYGLPDTASPNDPYANTAMAAEYIKENIKVFINYTKDTPTYYDIYTAHLISPLRAARLSEMHKDVLLANEWPMIANANKTLFFNRDGTARTAAEFRYLIKHKVNRALNVYGELAEVALVQFKDHRIMMDSLSTLLIENMSCAVTAIEPTEVEAVYFMSVEPDGAFNSCPIPEREIIGIRAYTYVSARDE